MEKTFRDQLAEMRDLVPDANGAAASRPPLPVEEKETLKKLMETAQNLVKELDASKPKLESLQKYPGRLGDSVRSAIRTTPGVVGPIQKFVKELRRAVEELERT